MHTKLVAKTLIFGEKNRILAIRRAANDKHRPGGWDLPGGGLFMAEDPTVGALREIEEEAGVEVNLIRLLHVHSQMKEPGTFMISLIFGAVADSEEVTLSPEHSEFRWCTPDEFEELDIPDKYKVAAATFLRSKTAL